MYVITNGKVYLALGIDNRPTTTNDYNKAKQFEIKQKAENFLLNLKSTLKRFDWKIEEIEDKNILNVITENEFTYIPTDLEKEDFDIFSFFKNTIIITSQLKAFAKNMNFQMRECGLKLSDITHFLRREDTRLNVVQRSRILDYLQTLERERERYKRSKVLANVLIGNCNRLENKDYLRIIDNIANSEYKPHRLSREDIEAIINTKKCEILA